MSLRLRLTLVITLLFLVGTLIVMGRSLINARQEIKQEIEFSRQITSQLLALFTLRSDQIEQDVYMSALSSQLTGLQATGRFSIHLTPSDEIVSAMTPIDASELDAPLWFLDLLGIDESKLIIFHDMGNIENIVVRVNPIGEINEIWEETRYTITTRLGTILTVAMVLYLLVGHWLKPINYIISALEQLVRGDFSKRIPVISLSEINEVGQKINHLASVLGSSKLDNERLTRQAMSVQEKERRFLAQELHDSLGQSVSAVKAMALSIANRTKDKMPQVAENALNIEKIADDAYQSVRNLMAWLRPAVLDELGLTLALEQMVDDWNVHHEETFCSLRMESDLTSLVEQQIQVYRIVQEALTNVAKHAQASRVNVVISGHEIISLIISDDGKGFDGTRVRIGIGLSNIRDRANLLHGELSVSSKRGKGTTLQIEFPRGQIKRRRNERK